MEKVHENINHQICNKMNRERNRNFDRKKTADTGFKIYDEPKTLHQFKNEMKTF